MHDKDSLKGEQKRVIIAMSPKANKVILDYLSRTTNERKKSRSKAKVFPTADGYHPVPPK